MAFSDHAPDPSGYDSAFRMAPGEFDFYYRTITEKRNALPDKVLLGIEADYYEGCEPYLSEWLPKWNFDLIIGSVHYIGDWAFDNPDLIHKWNSVDITGAWRAYFKLLEKLVNTQLFHVAAHLDLPKKFGHRPPDKTIAELVAPVLDAIAGNNMALELNTSGLKRPAREVYPSTQILQMAHERKIPICFASDAHSPNDIGYGFDQAVRAAKDAGYTEAVLFNAGHKTPYPLP